MRGVRLSGNNKTFGDSSRRFVEALNYVGTKIAATMPAPGMRRRGKVSQRMDLMEVARNAGRKAVKR